MKKIVIITAALALAGCDEQPQINIEEHVLEELTIVNGGQILKSPPIRRNGWNLSWNSLHYSLGRVGGFLIRM